MNDATPSLRISGSPTPEEIAAVVAVLGHVAARQAAQQRAPGRVAWQYAGRLEAVAGRVVRTRADLIRP
jgi:hypothetical protein